MLEERFLGRLWMQSPECFHFWKGSIIHCRGHLSISIILFWYYLDILLPCQLLFICWWGFVLGLVEPLYSGNEEQARRYSEGWELGEQLAPPIAVHESLQHAVTDYISYYTMQNRTHAIPKSRDTETSCKNCFQLLHCGKNQILLAKSVVNTLRGWMSLRVLESYVSRKIMEGPRQGRWLGNWVLMPRMVLLKLIMYIRFNSCACGTKELQTREEVSIVGLQTLREVPGSSSTVREVW